MKRLRILTLSVLVLMLTSFGQVALAADEAQLVDSFKQIVNDQMKTLQANFTNGSYVKFNNEMKPPYWVRVTDSLENQRFDIQRTNSLLYPYLAILEFDIKHTVYSRAVTKDDAQKADGVWFTTVDTYRIAYSYQNNAWIVTEKKRLDRNLNKWFEVTEDISNIKPPAGD